MPGTSDQVLDRGVAALPTTCLIHLPAHDLEPVTEGPSEHLRLPICKMRTVIVPPSQSCCEDSMRCVKHQLAALCLCTLSHLACATIPKIHVMVTALQVRPSPVPRSSTPLWPWRLCWGQSSRRGVTNVLAVAATRCVITTSWEPPSALFCIRKLGHQGLSYMRRASRVRGSDGLNPSLSWDSRS